MNLANNIQAFFGRYFNFWDTAMDANLRALSDHFGNIKVLAEGQPATAGYAILVVDGTYNILNNDPLGADLVAATYPAKRGLVASDGQQFWVNSGTSWDLKSFGGGAIDLSAYLTKAEALTTYLKEPQANTIYRRQDVPITASTKIIAASGAAAFPVEAIVLNAPRFIDTGVDVGYANFEAATPRAFVGSANATFIGSWVNKGMVSIDTVVNTMGGFDDFETGYQTTAGIGGWLTTSIIKRGSVVLTLVPRLLVDDSPGALTWQEVNWKLIELN
jgi:hypothetical protein